MFRRKKKCPIGYSSRLILTDDGYKETFEPTFELAEEYRRLKLAIEHAQPGEVFECTEALMQAYQYAQRQLNRR